MAHKSFKYLIPLYAVWFVLHIALFMAVVISSTISGKDPGLIIIPVLISHFLVIFTGVALEIYMIVDCVKRKFKKKNEMVVWIIVMVFLSALGAIIYYYVHGRKPGSIGDAKKK